MTLESAVELAPLVFSDSYAESRRKFLSATPNAIPYPCGAKGPAGEDLYTDVAYFGSNTAKNLLVLVSGTHGAEGYCGSAGQNVFIASRLHEQLPDNTAVLIIHALNCYGFAWDRIVTAEGIDLNRNFIDFTLPLPDSSAYEELANYIVPVDISAEGVALAEDAVAEFCSKHGRRKFQQARSSGQFTRPGGMSYGGQAPSEARQTLERIATDFDVASRERVIIIDYHTGLGPYGYGELQCEQVSGIAGYERATDIFGVSATSPDVGTSTSVPLHGSQDEFWERLLGSRHTYVCLEFGTCDIDTVRKAQRDDLWLYKYRPEEIDAPLGRKIRQATKHCFYPQKIDWKEMVVWRAHQVHRQALEALSSPI